MRVLMGPVMGLGPAPAEAADAWQRIDGFFQRQLA
jgi:dienelactone hydrolase